LLSQRAEGFEPAKGMAGKDSRTFKREPQNIEQGISNYEVFSLRYLSVVPLVDSFFIGLNLLLTDELGF